MLQRRGLSLELKLNLLKITLVFTLYWLPCLYLPWMTHQHSGRAPATSPIIGRCSWSAPANFSSSFSPRQPIHSPPCYLSQFYAPSSPLLSREWEKLFPEKRIIIICGSALESNVSESWSNYRLWQMGPAASSVPPRSLRRPVGRLAGRQTQRQGTAHGPPSLMFAEQHLGVSSHNINFNQIFKFQGAVQGAQFELWQEGHISLGHLTSHQYSVLTYSRENLSPVLQHKSFRARNQS